MNIEFFGTGAGLPAKHRNVTGIALNLVAEINEVWLFDVGEGTQRQLLHSQIRPRKISKIFITHLHGDHIFGLPGLLSSRSFQNGDDKPEDMDIYAPKGVEEFVRMSLKISRTRLNYHIRYHEINDGEMILNQNGFQVTATLLQHGIDSYGFRVVEESHEGELLIEKLKPYNIPTGPLLGKLKRGERVQLEDGRILDGKDFVGERKPGRVVTILGDTKFTEKSIQAAVGADVLVHEATYEAGQEKMAAAHFHSTTGQAAKIAKLAGAKKLLLTHLSARYMIHDHSELQKQAAKTFSNTRIVKDFDVIEIPLKKGDNVE
ncbi:MAG: ribonuclease Z [Streptococcaceae bacterium]|nr:ribonuclease Z [Streptococcaceae bacterium]